MRRSLALALAAPLVLFGCNPSAPPVVTPVPLPVIQEPAYVQQACTVLRWAVPVVSGLVTSLPPALKEALDRSSPALAACAAGNATDAIVALATELQSYLIARGVRPPAGVPVLRR